MNNMKRIYTFLMMCAVAMMPLFATSYKVLIIDPNGGTNTMIAHNLSYDKGASFVVTPPVRAGYTFAGWSGSGTAFLSHTLAAGSAETSFDGKSTYYNLGTAQKYTDKITVNLWAYMDNWGEYATANMRMISCTSTGGWSISKSSEGKIRWQCYDATKGGYCYVYGGLWSSLETGWHMFTMSFDGRNLYAYIDGVLQGSSAIFKGDIGYHASNSIILGAGAGTGATPSGNYFKGKLKDVSITHAYVNAEGVKELYTETKKQHGDNLKAMRFFMPTTSKKLVAKWTKNPATSFTLDANGGVNTTSQDTYSQSAGTALTVSDPVRAGAKFAGWSTETSQYVSNKQGFACSSPSEVTFNGTSTYFDLGKAYKYKDAITVSLWGYMDNWANYKTSNMRLISCAQGGGWSIESSGEKIQFAIYDGGKGGYNSVILTKKWSELKAGWHMFTFTFDGTRAFGYIDGKLLGRSDAFKGNIGYNSANSILVGAEAGSDNLPATTPCYFKGKIKNLCIMHTAITEEEVAVLYANPGVTRVYFPSSNHTMVATWNMNASTNLTIDVAGGVNMMDADSYSQPIGTGLTLTAPQRSQYDFVHWDKASSRNVSNYQGIVASSPDEVIFNGTSTYYNLGRDYMFTDMLSINVWAYMDNWTDYATKGMRIVSCMQGGGWGFEQSSDGKTLVFQGYDSGVGYKGVRSNIALSDMAAGWHMLTYVFDGMCIRGYMDGKLVATGKIFDSGKLGYNSTNSVLVGAEPAAGNVPATEPGYFQGKLKNLAIMHTALTPDEVAQLFDSPGLMRYYFDSSNTTLKAVWKESSVVPTPTIAVNADAATLQAQVGKAIEQTFTVVGTDLSGEIEVLLTGVDADLFSLSVNSLVAEGGTVGVRYNPQAVGTHEARITLRSAGATEQHIQLTGEAVVPTIGVDMPACNWDMTLVGTSVDKTLHVTGLYIADVITLALSGEDAEQFSISTPSLMSEGGAVTISYTPTSVGSHSATLTLSAADATSVIVPLSGTAETPTPMLSVDSLEVIFNAVVNTSSVQTIEVSAANLTGEIALTLTGADAALFTLSPETLGAEGGKVVITYYPTATGVHTATLTVSATGVDAQSVVLQGTASEQPPTLYVSNSALSFASIIGSSAERTLTVTGEYLPDDVLFSLEGEHAAYFSLSANSLSAAGGDVTIKYASAEEGTHTATLHVTALGVAAQTVTLTGETTSDIVLHEEWNFSGISGKTADWIVNGKQVTQDMAFLNGKLYVVHRNGSNSDNKIYIVDAYKGTQVGELNTSTCSGGTYTLSSIEVMDGKIVASSLASTGTDKLVVYYWEDDEAAPTELLSTTSHGGVRVGDAFAVSGTLADGKLWYSNQDNVLYYPITDGVCAVEPKVLQLTKAGSAFNLGDGSAASGIVVEEDGSLWLSGKDQLTTHFDAMGVVEESLPSSLLGNKQGTAAQFFSYAGKQYVVATTYLNRTPMSTLTEGAFVLANITNGIHTATKLGTYPSVGLSSVRNSSFRNTLCVDVREAGVHVWILMPMQGAAYYCYGDLPSLPTSVGDVSGVDIQYVVMDDVLHVGGVQAKELCIFSLTGQKVGATTHCNEVSVAGLQGVYIVIVHDYVGGVYTSKVVIP